MKSPKSPTEHSLIQSITASQLTTYQKAEKLITGIVDKKVNSGSAFDCKMLACVMVMAAISAYVYIEPTKAVAKKFPFLSPIENELIVGTVGTNFILNLFFLYSFLDNMRLNDNTLLKQNNLGAKSKKGLWLALAIAFGSAVPFAGLALSPDVISGSLFVLNIGIYTAMYFYGSNHAVKHGSNILMRKKQPEILGHMDVNIDAVKKDFVKGTELFKDLVESYQALPRPIGISSSLKTPLQNKTGDEENADFGQITSSKIVDKNSEFHGFAQKLMKVLLEKKQTEPDPELSRKERIKGEILNGVYGVVQGAFQVFAAVMTLGYGYSTYQKIAGLASVTENDNPGVWAGTIPINAALTYLVCIVAWGNNAKMKSQIVNYSKEKELDWPLAMSKMKPLSSVLFAGMALMSMFSWGTVIDLLYDAMKVFTFLGHDEIFWCVCACTLTAYFNAVGVPDVVDKIMSFIVSNKFQKDDTKDQLEVLDLLNEARGKMGLFSSIEIRQLEREIDNDQKKKIKQGQLEIESENEDEDEDEVYGEDNKSGLGND